MKCSHRDHTVHRSVHSGVHKSVLTGVHYSLFWGVHCSLEVNTLVNTSKPFERKELSSSVHTFSTSQEKSPHTPLYARAQKCPTRGWVFTVCPGRVNSEHRSEQSHVGSPRPRCPSARPSVGSRVARSAVCMPRTPLGPSCASSLETHGGTLPLHPNLSFLPIAPNPRTGKALRVGPRMRS
jgi:hypothetical protein